MLGPVGERLDGWPWLFSPDAGGRIARNAQDPSRLPAPRLVLRAGRGGRPRAGCARRRARVAGRRLAHPQPLERRLRLPHQSADAYQGARRPLLDAAERGDGPALRPAVDGDDRPRRSEPRQAQPGAGVPRADPVARARARGAPVLRHGAQHAGHGPPHPDHSAGRGRGAGALRDREPLRCQRGLGPSPRSAPAVGGAAAAGPRAHAGARAAADPVREPPLPLRDGDRALRPRRAVGAPREQRPRARRVPRHGGRAGPPGRDPHRPEHHGVPRRLLEPGRRRPWAASTR